jgi:hypothetical protein
MVEIVRALALIFADMFRSRARLEAEVVVLRHRLNVALRKCGAPVGLTNYDRAFLVWLFRLFPTQESNNRYRQICNDFSRLQSFANCQGEQQCTTLRTGCISARRRWR